MCCEMGLAGLALMSAPGAAKPKPPRAPRPVTGRMVLIWLVAFFGVVIAVNGVMTKLAIDTLSGTDVENPYQVGLAYNDEIEAAAKQAALGWHIDGQVARGGDGRASIRVEARDAGGAALAGLAVTADLERPINKRADHSAVLNEAGNGLYRADVSGVAPGQWELVLTVHRGADRVFLSRNRIVLP